MSEHTYFRSQRVLVNGALRPASIHVNGGRIARVSDYDDVPAGATVHGTDHVILPGVVDSHVHVNEPGRTEWEGFKTATRAAAAGGITTIVDMPLNSIPATTTASALLRKTEQLDGLCRVDVGLWGGAVPENTSGDARGLSKLLERGALGFKCFLLPSGVDEFPFVSERDLREAMDQLRGTDATLMVHAELEGPIDAAARTIAEQIPPADPRSYATYLRSRPKSAEDAAVELLFDLCKRTGTRVHIVHLSSSGALTTLARARDMGLPLTAETAPHYLYFFAEQIPDGATWFKCAPPIRDRDNRDQLWKALEDGLLSMVVSDHSPCTPALKHTNDGDFMAAWGGIAGLQFSFAAVWTEASRRGVPLATVARWMTEAPARHAGMFGRKGAILPGFDADLVFFDPDRLVTVRAPFIHHRHKLSPYEGETLRGVAVETYLRGALVSAADFAVSETSAGRWLPRA
jgi:allantoinase